MSIPVQWLRELADSLDRPLHLVFRGGADDAIELSASFAGLTLLDTNAFLKTVKRQRAILRQDEIAWEPSPTGVGEPLDNLLAHNIATMSKWLKQRIGAVAPMREASGSYR